MIPRHRLVECGVYICEYVNSVRVCIHTRMGDHICLLSYFVFTQVLTHVLTLQANSRGVEVSECIFIYFHADSLESRGCLPCCVWTHTCYSPKSVTSWYIALGIFALHVHMHTNRQSQVNHTFMFFDYLYIHVPMCIHIHIHTHAHTRTHTHTDRHTFDQTSLRTLSHMISTVYVHL